MQNKYKKGFALNKDIYERASKKAKEEHGLDVSVEEFEELDSILKKYMKEALKDKKLFGVFLPGLGTAYYRKSPCNKKKFYSKKQEIRDRWRYRVEKIMEFYENNAYNRNRRRTYRNMHLEKSVVERARRRGYSIEDIMEIQNKIGK